MPDKKPPPIEQAAPGGIERPANGNPRAAGQSEPAERSPSDVGAGLGRPVGHSPADRVAKENQCATEGELSDPDCRDLTAQERMAYAAIGQLILTAVGVILIWRTLVYTRVAAKAAEATVVEAKESTRAALRAADAAAEAIHVERAWVSQAGFKSAVFDGWIDETPCKHGLAISISWKNTGRSPAVDARVYAEVRVLGLADQLPWFEPTFPKEESVGTMIGPDQNADSSFRFLNDEEYTLLRERKVHVVIFSRVVYHDIYRQNKHSHSEICATVNYNGERSDNGGRPHPNISLSPVGPQNTAS